MGRLRFYIRSFRLRTLPLSVSGIVLGSLLAASEGCFDTAVFCLAVVTTLLLQILSNVANEYGDYMHGTDTEQRVGMHYSLAEGGLSAADFRRMIVVLVILGIVSGVVLVWAAVDVLFSRDGLVMIAIGAAAVLAALGYTLGRHPYGYVGLGDLFVLLFFGFASTGGSYFLMCGKMSALVLLPALGCGLLSVGVLNVNNIRDMETDRATRRTVPIMLGERNAKIYHALLVTGAFAAFAAYRAVCGAGWQGWLFVAFSPFFALHVYRLVRQSGRQLDARLPELSILTLAMCVVYGLTGLL